MRKFLTIIVYTLIVLLIGRNLLFLPRFSLFSNPATKTGEITTTLRARIQKDFEKFPGNYSYYVANLSSGAQFGQSEKETFTAASVNKVPIVATLYFLNKKEKIKLDERITIQENDIQDYGTGRLRYEKPGGIYSLRTLAKLALNESDNTAAHVLSNKIGPDVIQKTVESFGLTQTDIENNKTSVYDMFLLFKKIYSGDITTATEKDELLNYMKDTDIENRIPAELPTDTIVFHKTGDGEGFVHDVGIIVDKNNAYFLGILTSDMSGHEDTVAKTMGHVGKELVEFYRQEH